MMGELFCHMPKFSDLADDYETSLLVYADDASHNRVLANSVPVKPSRRRATIST